MEVKMLKWITEDFEISDVRPILVKNTWGINNSIFIQKLYYVCVV